MAEAILELDLLKREEIADALGIDVSEVTNRRKVLKRKLAEHLNVENEG
jgi:DNA-directed RNA polymerase specialized sigma24 family protein